ncbi:ABC transporter ATP-binding protein, partial [Butyrivibrio sp. LC3010]|uniref:ABC transporter ATP-binding protein n=1 Tax=Butyrivibrio sp. LC3010 TaxID=1280680 RepID=UPI00047B5FC1
MEIEYKESKDNPLHREYGIWSNTVYILKKMWQYKPGVLFLVILGIVCNSVLSYFWGIFGKYVIDIIQLGLSRQEGIRQLARLMLVAGSINLVLNFGRALSDNRVWFNLIDIRMRMLTERIAKVLTLRYELIERPDVLDIAERATRATNSDDNGVQGMMQLMRQVLTSAFTLVVTFAAILILDYRLIIALIILGLLQFLYYRKIVRVDKEEVWDKMSPASRKSEYMTRITQDFDFAKDIRLFGLSDFLSGKQEEVNKETIEKMDLHRDLWYKHAFVVQIAYVIIKGLIYATLFVAVFKKNLSISD